MNAGGTPTGRAASRRRGRRRGRRRRRGRGALFSMHAPESTARRWWKPSSSTATPTARVAATSASRSSGSYAAPAASASSASAYPLEGGDDGVEVVVQRSAAHAATAASAFAWTRSPASRTASARGRGRRGALRDDDAEAVLRRLGLVAAARAQQLEQRRHISCTACWPISRCSALNAPAAASRTACSRRTARGGRRGGGRRGTGARGPCRRRPSARSARGRRRSARPPPSRRLRCRLGISVRTRPASFETSSPSARAAVCSSSSAARPPMIFSVSVGSTIRSASARSRRATSTRSWPPGARRPPRRCARCRARRGGRCAAGAIDASGESGALPARLEDRHRLRVGEAEHESPSSSALDWRIR